MRNLAKAMTIAGSDSGGGAGIQADLKTFAAMGVYGTSVLTAITAQNTQTVTEVVDMPGSMIRSQIDAVVSDIGADAVKTGMLSSAGIIETVAEKVTEHGMTPLVVDPVMVAKGGARLLREDAVEALKTLLIPLATVVTPNIPETEALVGRKIEDMDDMRDAAEEIIAFGAQSRRRQGRTHGRPGYRPLLRRHGGQGLHVAQNIDRQHARDRLHVRVGHRRRPRQGQVPP